MIEGPETFNRQINVIKRNWKLILYVGCFVLLFRSGLFYYEYVITWQPEEKTPTNDRPGVSFNEQKDAQNQENTPYLDLFFNNIISLGFVPVFGMLVITIVTLFGQLYQTQKPVDDLYQLYEISKVKRFTGEISFSDNVIIRIEWNSKGFFLLTHKGNIIAQAKSSELYWKLFYLGYKLNSEN